jgi:WD40 repeat protein
MMHGDSKLLSGYDDYAIKVWNTGTWTCERALEGHVFAVNCVEGHGDGPALFALCMVVHRDKLISGSSPWCWPCDQCIEHRHVDMRAYLEDHDDAAYCVVMNGHTLISSSSGRTIRVWSTYTWTRARTRLED